MMDAPRVGHKKEENMPNRDRVQALIALVEQGKFVEALETFYAEDASMQENTAPPRRGLAKLVAHERRVMAAYKETRGRHLDEPLVQGDRVVIHWLFEFETASGVTVTLDELAYQLWRGDKVVAEQFYYDPAQLPR
jgi:hypothetical protein